MSTASATRIIDFPIPVGRIVRFELPAEWEPDDWDLLAGILALCASHWKRHEQRQAPAAEALEVKPVAAPVAPVAAPPARPSKFGEVTQGLLELVGRAEGTNVLEVVPLLERCGVKANTSAASARLDMLVTGGRAIRVRLEGQRCRYFARQDDADVYAACNGGPPLDLHQIASPPDALVAQLSKAGQRQVAEEFRMHGAGGPPPVDLTVPPTPSSVRRAEPVVIVPSDVKRTVRSAPPGRFEVPGGERVEGAGFSEEWRRLRSQNPGAAPA